jgi:hypothetical protein
MQLHCALLDFLTTIHRAMPVLPSEIFFTTPATKGFFDVHYNMVGKTRPLSTQVLKLYATQLNFSVCTMRRVIPLKAHYKTIGELRALNGDEQAVMDLGHLGKCPLRTNITIKWTGARHGDVAILYLAVHCEGSETQAREK